MPRPLLALFSLSLLSCGPRPVPDAPEPHVWTVSPRALHNSYLDASERWTGERVRIRIPAGSCVRSGRSLLWHADRPSAPPDIAFDFPLEVPDGERAVEVVGVCRGRVWDHRERASGARWFVRVEVTATGE